MGPETPLLLGLLKVILKIVPVHFIKICFSTVSKWLFKFFKFFRSYWHSMTNEDKETLSNIFLVAILILALCFILKSCHERDESIRITREKDIKKEEWIRDKENAVQLVKNFYYFIASNERSKTRGITTPAFQKQIELMDDFKPSLKGEAVDFSLYGILEPFLVDQDSKKIFYAKIRRQHGNLSEIGCRLFVLDKFPEKRIYREEDIYVDVWKLVTIEPRSVECENSTFKRG